MAGLDGEGRAVWRDWRRFGWEIPADGAWKDRTLPAGKAVIVDVADVQRAGAKRIEVNLVYRFRPGDFDAPDDRQIILDKAGINLPDDR